MPDHSNESVLLLAGMPDALGLWAPLPHAATTLDLAAPSAAPPLLWLAYLPAAPASSLEALAESERRLALAQSAIESAPGRLAAWLARAAGAPVADRILALDSAALPAPERALLAQLAAVQAAGTVAAADLGGDLARARDTLDAFRTFLERLRQSLTYYAWVETVVDGLVLARTVVTWKCDMASEWDSEITGEDSALHMRTLALALATRNTWIRMLALAGRGAALLAGLPALLATPVGPLVALSLVWKYLSDLAQQAQA